MSRAVWLLVLVLLGCDDAASSHDGGAIEPDGQLRADAGGADGAASDGSVNDASAQDGAVHDGSAADGSSQDGAMGDGATADLWAADDASQMGSDAETDAVVAETDGALPGDAGAGADAGPGPVACGEGEAPVAQIRGTEGVTIGADGTLYYSQQGHVGRARTGQAVENQWVRLPGAGTVWGVVIDDDGILYAGSPSGDGWIFRVDTTEQAPEAEVWVREAGAANGLTLTPGGTLYYGDFGGGHVYRVNGQNDTTRVTRSGVPSVNGLLVRPDGDLLALAYGQAAVWHLTLDAEGLESDRNRLIAVPNAALDGIAELADGDYLLTDNRNGRVLRYSAAFGNQRVLRQGVGAAANMVFGRGALRCTDVYVTSSGAMVRLELEVGGRP